MSSRFSRVTVVVVVVVQQQHRSVYLTKVTAVGWSGGNAATHIFTAEVTALGRAAMQLTLKW